MFKEVVSLAIISSFVLNIIYVSLPNSISYTIGFVLSLAVMSPFVLWWRHLTITRAVNAAREAHEDAIDLAYVSVSGVGGDDAERPGADLEKGLGNVGVVEVQT